jgi:predicted methyltransferase
MSGPNASGPRPGRLTQLAHERLRPLIPAGAIAIDATAGNGWDTAFLLECVGPSGRVFAFDVQHVALASTRVRIAPLAGAGRVALILQSHAELKAHLPVALHGHVDAAMFNLGYLPGADHTLVTQQSSTIAALAAVRDVLRPGGALSILAYPGHPGGADETAAVAAWVQSSGLAHVAGDTGQGRGPRFWLLRK